MSEVQSSFKAETEKLKKDKEHFEKEKIRFGMEKKQMQE